MHIHKILLVSSTIALAKNLGIDVTKIHQLVKRLKLETVDDVQRIKKIVIKYLRSLSASIADSCIVSPAIGVAPYIHRVLSMSIVSPQILLAVKRPYPTNPYDIKYLIDDAEFWIPKLRRALSEASNGFTIKFIVYYDPVFQWHILLDFIPIIISIDLSSFKSVLRCKEVQIAQFIKHKVFDVIWIC